MKDLLNICGFMLPDKADVTANGVTDPDRYDCPSSYFYIMVCSRMLTQVMIFSRMYGPSNELCMDHRLWPSVVPSDERLKHAFYCQRHNDDVSTHIITLV